MEKLYFIFYCIQTKIQNFNQTKNHGQVRTLVKLE